MLKFILLVFLADPTGLTPVHVQPFETLGACQAARVEVLRQVPRLAEVTFVAECARVRNGTEVAV